MPASGDALIGITEAGHVAAGPTDVDWGRNQQNGASIALASESVTLLSAQAKMAERADLVSADIQVTIRLVHPNLQNVQRASGAPDSTFTGDLEGTPTATAEVWTLDEGSLGSEQRALYILAPGPASTRRVDAAVCRVTGYGTIEFASNAYQLFEATWSVLNTADGTGVFIITDAT